MENPVKRHKPTAEKTRHLLSWEEFVNENKTSDYSLECGEESISEKTSLSKTFREYCTNSMWTNKSPQTLLFDKHFSQEWLEEKYKPSHLIIKLSEAIQSVPQALNAFKESFDSLDIGSVTFRTDDELKSDLPFADNAVMIRGLSTQILRRTIRETFSPFQGFTGILLSEPNGRENFERAAIVRFDSQESCKAFIDNNPFVVISDERFEVFPNRHSFRKFKTAPPVALTEFRIERDLHLCKQIVQLLDEQKHISDPFLSEKISELSPTPLQELNIHLLYLRNVHLFCFYCAREFSSPNELDSKCSGPGHGRTPLEGEEYYKDQMEKDENDHWVDRLEENIISFKEHLNRFEDQESLNEYLLQDFYVGLIQKLTPEKARCGKCQKLFRSPEFVRKHLNNKHKEDIESHLEFAERYEYFRNFMRDSERPDFPVYHRGSSRHSEYAPPPRTKTIAPSFSRGRKLVSYVDVDEPVSKPPQKIDYGNF